MAERARPEPPDASASPRGPAGPASPANRELLETRIRRFAEEANRFSREFVEVSGSVFIRDPVRSAERNVELAKSIFSKWSIEILLALYELRELGFQELRDTLRVISPRVLSERLRTLDQRGLVQRRVLSTRPTRVRYSLTQDGLVLARLGEPIFIFLKYRREQSRHHERGAGARRTAVSDGHARRRQPPRPAA